MRYLHTWLLVKSTRRNNLNNLFVQIFLFYGSWFPKQPYSCLCNSKKLKLGTSRHKKHAGGVGRKYFRQKFGAMNVCAESKIWFSSNFEITNLELQKIQRYNFGENLMQLRFSWTMRHLVFSLLFAK